MTSEARPELRSPGENDPARTAVARVVQRMVAQRLGKGLLPLLLVFLFGVLQMGIHGPAESDSAVLVLGSVAAGGAMLLYGNGAVRRALGTERRAAGRARALVGLLPYAFALYLMGFRGLRPLSSGSLAAPDATRTAVALVFVFLSARLLWDLSRLTRLHGLARVMTVPAPGEGG